MDNKRFKELVEIAKQESKNDFIRFVKGIYNVNEIIFDYMWKVPVMASYDGDKLIKTTLSTKTEDELLDYIDDFIAGELGNAEGCFISLSKMGADFTDEEKEEWRKKEKNGEGKLGYNAIIVYNESELEKNIRELEKENSGRKKTTTQKEIEQLSMEYIKKVITHERCHLNANSLDTEIIGNKIYSEELNGAEMTSWKYDELVSGKIRSRVDGPDYSDRNEVLVDTLSLMMSNYHDGDTVEDCLYKIIKDRNGKSQYKNIDDREVLTMYSLFPNELTEWATFGAYDFVRQNKLQLMIEKVCGTDEPLRHSKFKEKVENYIKSLEENELSDKQKEMLEMLGINIEKKVSKKDMKDVAISEEAMGALDGSLLDVRTAIEKYNKEREGSGSDGQRN